jgi:hypothetical protein
MANMAEIEGRLVGGNSRPNCTRNHPITYTHIYEIIYSYSRLDILD